MEADIRRYERAMAISDALHSRTKGRQTTEAAIAGVPLNCMLELEAGICSPRLMDMRRRRFRQADAI